MIMGRIALACVLAVPAAHAQTPITADVAATWSHEQSGLSAPPALAGFDRYGIVQYDGQQRDVAVSYRDQTSKTEATLYVFFAGLPDVSLWHDRIKVAMGSGLLGTPDFTTALQTSFSAPGEARAGGLRTTAVMTGKPTQASGVAIFAHDGWLIVTRMSSYTLDREALDARLAAFVAALPLLAGKTPPAPVYVVVPCVDTYDPPQANLAANGTDPSTAVMLGIEAATMEKLQDDKKVAVSAKPAHWCRGTPSQIGFGVYRNAGEPGYVIAIGDSGSAVSVVPDPIASELHKSAPAFAVFLATTSDRTAYGVFAGVPSFRQAIDLINAHHPLVGVTRATRPGDKTNINIFTDPAKKAP